MEDLMRLSTGVRRDPNFLDPPESIPETENRELGTENEGLRTENRELRTNA